MSDTTPQFTSSIILDEHPFKDIKFKVRQQYYITLEYFLKNCENNDFSRERLRQYHDFLIGNEETLEIPQDIAKGIVRSMVNNRYKPWRKKYRYLLVCDLALILVSKTEIFKAIDLLHAFLSSNRKIVLLDSFVADLTISKDYIPNFIYAENIIKQFKKNNSFISEDEMRFIITANMSAGKSTLINALIGKSLARTSQEVCTGNICYLYNKPFEDNNIHLMDSKLNFNASYIELMNFEWLTSMKIASYFRSLHNTKNRICIIDTPGVNSATNRKHGKIARESLKNEQYNKLVYVLNANKLGTDEEIKHLRWVSENIPKDKIIFVLNKIDDFNAVDDDIRTSVDGVRNDLLSLGYENPIICPMSAYFALLIKMKNNGDIITEDELDEYNLYKKKFRKKAYDLSEYYEGISIEENDSEEITLSKKCGLYGLEKILFGGEV